MRNYFLNEKKMFPKFYGFTSTIKGEKKSYKDVLLCLEHKITSNDKINTLWHTIVNLIGKVTMQYMKHKKKKKP